MRRSLAFDRWAPWSRRADPAWLGRSQLATVGNERASPERVQRVFSLCSVHPLDMGIRANTAAIYAESTGPVRARCADEISEATGGHRLPVLGRSLQ